MSEQSKQFFCTKPWTSFEINDHKGAVTPCCWSKLDCGNVNDASIEEIWNGSSYRQLRKQMAAGRLDLICRQSCPYRLGEHVDIQYPPPRSEIFKANWELQQTEIHQRKSVLESKPTIMNICPTVACNLNCVMCFQDRDDTVELPEHIDEIVASYFPILQELWILGGEPLISKECIEIITRMDPQAYPDLHLGLITNGTAVSPRIEHLLRNRRISWILVSIDAATQETYKNIRGGKLEKVIDGVRRLRSIRDLQDQNWNLKIGFTVMKSNMHEALEFANLAHKLGVDVQYTPVFGTNHGENYYGDPKLVEEAKKILLQLADHIEYLGGDRIRIMPVWTRLLALITPNHVTDYDISLPFEEWKNELERQGITTED